ncbi:MAG: hypothetical protein IKJ19_01150, partial [Clostridia bacterium]|nr:hypothetical protein [Clostridia bacterium]
VLASANVINNVIGGRLNGLGYRDMKPIVELSDAVRGLVNSILDEKNAVVEAIFDEINVLYVDSTIASFAGDSKDLSINLLITSVANVLVEAITTEKADTIVSDVATLANLIVGGTLTSVGYHGKTTVVKVSEATEKLLGDIVELNNVGKAVFIEINELYAGSTLETFVKDTED